MSRWRLLQNDLDAYLAAAQTWQGPEPIGLVYKVDGAVLCSFDEEHGSKTLAELFDDVSRASLVPISQCRIMRGEQILVDCDAQVFEGASVEQPVNLTFCRIAVVRPDPEG